MTIILDVIIYNYTKAQRRHCRRVFSPFPRAPVRESRHTLQPGKHWKHDAHAGHENHGLFMYVLTCTCPWCAQACRQAAIRRAVPRRCMHDMQIMIFF